MSSSKFFTLQEADINNNCPECYSNSGLKITFKQRLTETIFYKAITDETISEMHCANCNTQIFPVRWTDDIERVVDYKKRSITPRTKSFKLKPLAWAFLLFDILLLVVIVLFVMDIISFN